MCQVAQLIGFHDPESWGVWAARDPARIKLKEPINGAIRLQFAAYTMNDKAPHQLKIGIGDVTKTVTLTPQSASFDLDYSLSRPAQEIVLSGIVPRSPQSLGLSSDGRKLGVGLIKVDCEAMSSIPKQN
jgi:phosphoglycerol transferase